MPSLLEDLQTALAGRYEIQSELGRGGMATVYRAHDLRHDRPVAIKLLSPELAATIGVERFLREIQIAARLSHPHILPVYDSGEANGLLFYVMPLVTGESLRDRLNRETQLSIDDAVTIACEMADALGTAHQYGVIHRDVKPENVLLSGGHAVVADFGIARIVDDVDAGATPTPAPKLTATGMSVGTAAYMSPEQFAAQAVDGRSDIYSLGCVLYEMLVGETPFTGPNMMAIMARAMTEPAPSIRVVRASVPDHIEAVVQQALEKVPADRFKTMSEFKEALLGRETSTYTARTMRYTAARAAQLRPPSRPAWHRRAIAVGIAAVLLVGGLLARRQSQSGWKNGLAGLFSIAQAGQETDGARTRRLAVLYFADDSRDGSLRYLADGLTTSLIERLSQVSALQVSSEDAVAPLRGRDVDVDSVARVLDVGSLVRGSVEPARGGVRVTVRLVDGESGAEFGRKAFTFASGDVLALQDTVAQEIASFLRERLGSEVRLRERRNATRSLPAWTLVQRAEKLRKDADSLKTAGAAPAATAVLLRADSLLAEAEGLDAAWPTVPTLRATVAFEAAEAARDDRERLPALVENGLAYAARALDLDPRSADAYEQRGNLLWFRFHQHLDPTPQRAERTLVEAESALVRAVSINGNQGGAWATLSAVHYRKPDLQQASIAALNAYRADAFLSSAKVVLTRLFMATYNLEQFPEATAWCREGKRRFPREPFFTECRLLLYMAGRPSVDPDSAWAYAAEYVQLSPPAARERARRKAETLVAGALVRAEARDSARRVLARAAAGPELDPTRSIAGYQAVVRVMLGEQDAAVRLIADYLSVNPEHRRGFADRTMWWWRDLQGNARFRTLIAGAY